MGRSARHVLVVIVIEAVVAFLRSLPTRTATVQRSSAREPSHRLRVGVSYGAFASTLAFFDSEHGDHPELVDIGEQAVLGTLQYRASDRWTLQASAGVLVSGGIANATRALTMRPGWLFGVAASCRLLDGHGWLPFILVSGSLSASSTALEDAQFPGSGYHDVFSAMDVSGVLTVGKTLFRAISPYLVGRVFGGPVFWHDGSAFRGGTDIYHYQLGAGVAVSLLQRFDAFIEGAPLGERRISAGAGVSF
jgi:hypothetical protein